MNIVNGIMTTWSSLASYCMVPILIFTLAIIFRVKFGQALRSAVTMGAGLLGIVTITNMMVQFLTPIAEGLVSNAHLENDIMDLGIAPMFASAVALPFFIFLYPIGMLLNYLLIRIKWTKTLNADFMNFYNYLLPVLPVYILTGSVLWTFVGYVFFFAISLKIADISAPWLQDYYKAEGINAPGVFEVILTIALDWIFDHIPGIRKINFTLHDFKGKFAFLNDSTIMCLIIGLALGVIGRCDINTTLGLGIALAATSFLFPMAIGLLVEGMTPVSERMKEVMMKKFDSDDLFIGMDQAVFAGYPEVISVAAICIPLVMALYFVLPGMRMMPATDTLLNTPYMVCMTLPFAGSKGKKGNVFRTIVLVLLLYTIALYGAQLMQPISQDLIANSGIAIEEGTKVTSSLMGSWPNIIVYYITKFFANIF